MTQNDLSNAIDALLASDLSDAANRMVLADALEESGRNQEATLARNLARPVAVNDDGMLFDDGKRREMMEVLRLHGLRFSGDNAEDSASDWIDNDFDANDADEWCEIGVWNAATAADFRDAGLTPEQVTDAADRLVEGLDDPIEEYTDGCPIYATCNGDLSPDVIIAEVVTGNE